MRALVGRTYGPLTDLAVADLPTPEPGANQVRVRVHAAALNPADFKVVTGSLKILHGRRFPMTVGYDYSGVVEAVGAGVQLAVGAEVFGFLPYAMGNQRGSFAELLIADVAQLAAKPAGVSHVIAAAAATPGLTALQTLRDLGRIAAPRVRALLVTGASGGVGALAIGVARKLGATVTAIGSGKGFDPARALGATTVFDRMEASTCARWPSTVRST